MKRFLNSVYNARVDYHTKNTFNYTQIATIEARAKQDVESMIIYYYVDFFSNDLYDVDEGIAKTSHHSNGKIFTSLSQAKIFQLKRELEHVFISEETREELEFELEELGQYYPEYIV